MSTPQPTPPGERLAAYFEKFFTTIVGISTLGASISFSKVVQTPVKPWIDYGVSDNTVQVYVSMAFLLLVMDLAITSAAASALSLYRPQAVNYFGTSDSHERRIVMWWATIVSVVLFGLLFAAFIFLGLVVAAYTGPIGWFAVGFSAFFGLCVLAAIVWQSPIGSPPVQEPMLHPDESFSGFPSPEKREEVTPPEFARDDYFYNDETGNQGRYTDGGLSMGNTMPFIDPVVPPYMADLRRLRSMRASQDSRYGRKSEKPREDWTEAAGYHTYGNTPGY
jgi:hypothetical protein